MLYFGSFNPIHNGHIALCEYVIDSKLCDEVVLVVSPRNPLKKVAELAPEIDRFEMAEIACAASRYPEQIKPSVVEFMLERPSYTINTLRHLTENYGSQMEFSILMGADLVAQLEQWREYQSILDGYPIFVYPRRGEMIEKHLDKITIMHGAPLHNFSSTAVRDLLQRAESVDGMICEGVHKHIRGKGLWRPSGEIAELNQAVDQASSEQAKLQALVARGKWHYGHNDWGRALNDFNRALAIDPAHTEALELVAMAQEILAFRHIDIYNP